MKGMTIIVKTIARLLVGLIVLYGLYIVLHGHLTPGGGFAGGVILAAAFVLLLLAYGSEIAFRKMSEPLDHTLESLGGLAFLVIVLLGFAGGYAFFNFLSKGEPFALFSGGIIPLCNIAIGVKVGAGLFAIFLALVLGSPKRRKE